VNQLYCYRLEKPFPVIGYSLADIIGDRHNY